MQSLAGVIEGWLTPQRVRFISAASITVTLVSGAISFATAKPGHTAFGIPLGADYAAFYAAGKLLNEHPAVELYDADRIAQIYQSIHNFATPPASLPFAYPPFVALPFRALALLPYATSFFVWLIISAGCYAGAVALAYRWAGPGDAAVRRTALWVALSFEPFLMECWLGGQVSTVGLLFIAVAFALEWRGRHFLAGMALGICLYKPTLLILIVPMLLVTRRWRTLAGMVISGLLLGGLSLWTVGVTGCREYVGVVTGYTQATVGGPVVFRIWKFVDLVSFCRQLGGGGWWILAPVLAIWPVAVLLRSWWRGEAAWGGVLTLTLVLNLYVGIYDTVLLALALLLTPALWERRAGRWLVALVYVTPWWSQSAARGTGLQFFTLVLLGVGLYQLANPQRCQ